MPVWAGLLVAALILVVCAHLWRTYLRRRDRRADIPTILPPLYERPLSEPEPPRRERVRFVETRALDPGDREKFVRAWRATQTRFAEDSQGATLEAGRLVTEVMEARGYPTRELESGTAEVAADDPTVIQHYRAAREIVTRYERGEAGGDDLRKAMVFYRLLFEELLGFQEARR